MWSCPNRERKEGKEQTRENNTIQEISREEKGRAEQIVGDQNEQRRGEHTKKSCQSREEQSRVEYLYSPCSC
jgi:hypothetical protein